MIRVPCFCHTKTAVVQPRNPGKTENKTIKIRKMKKKKVRSLYPLFVDPALTNDKNKGAEKAPRVNEEMRQ